MVNSFRNKIAVCWGSLTAYRVPADSVVIGLHQLRDADGDMASTLSRSQLEKLQTHTQRDKSQKNNRMLEIQETHLQRYTLYIFTLFQFCVNCATLGGHPNARKSARLESFWSYYSAGTYQ